MPINNIYQPMDIDSGNTIIYTASYLDEDYYTNVFGECVSNTTSSFLTDCDSTSSFLTDTSSFLTDTSSFLTDTSSFLTDTSSFLTDY